MIEDLLSAGGAALEATLAVRDLGEEVSTAVRLIDPSERADGPLPDVNIATRAVLTKADLDYANSALTPSAD